MQFNDIYCWTAEKFAITMLREKIVLGNNLPQSLSSNNLYVLYTYIHILFKI